MIIHHHDIKQRSPEWRAIRRGKITASIWPDLFTPKGELRKGAEKAVLKIAAESMLPDRDDGYQSYAMMRGVALEPHARAFYELATGRAVKEVGFVQAGDPHIGCSPDGLVGTDGGIEIKCPMDPAAIALAHWSPLPDDYVTQSQACMYVTGAQWWDVVLYSEDDDGLMGTVERVERDEALHKKYTDALDKVLLPALRKALSVVNYTDLTRGVTLAQIQDRLGPAWARFTDASKTEINMEGLYSD